MPDVRGHHREPGAQQHHGEPQGPGAGHAVRAERAAAARRPRGRGARSSRTARRSTTGSSRSAQGIATRDAVPPEPWGRLSYVTGPFSPTIMTQPSVPLLDGLGQPTGATIYGATTITLTDEQRKLAAQSSKLWIQGGTQDGPDHRRRDLRVRRAALRDRQPQRRQRRVDLLSAGHHARVLLRVLREARADERHDHGAQGGLPAAGHARAEAALHRQHLLREQRVLPHRLERQARRADRSSAPADATWDFTEEIPALANARPPSTARRSSAA